MLDDVYGYQQLCESDAFREFATIIVTLTGMSAAIYPPRLDRMHCFCASQQINSICLAIRALPDGLAACNADEKARFTQVIMTRRPLRCICHAGFVELAMPIHHCGSLIAVLSSGQLLPEPQSEAGFQPFLALHERFGIPTVQLRAMYQQIPYFPSERLDAIVQLMTFFAQHMCETSQRLLDLEARVGTDYVSDACRYITAHCVEPLTLPDVAARVNVSPSHLSKRFSQITGMSFTEFLQRERISQAKHYLAQTDTPITEAAFLSGFSCLSQFNRTFRRLEGCTPREYRQHHR